MTSDEASGTPEPISEDAALDSVQVIELQAFSEKKAWILDKIKVCVLISLCLTLYQFLENMPPVEAFIGLDAIRDSAEHVPGLPSRAELQQWVIEHDAIEKETEIFDSGELKKLKKFTKGLSSM